MNGSKNNDNDNKVGEKEFNFFNEHIDGKKLGLGKLLALIISLAVIFGIVACVVFFAAKPFIKGLFEDESETTTVDNADVEIEITEKETTKSFEEKVDVLTQSFVTLAINEADEWGDVEGDNKNFTSGLILSKGEDVKILTGSDFKGEKGEVVVYFSDERINGNVYSEYKELGIMLISISKDDITDDLYDKMEPVRFADLNKTSVGTEIMYAGNPYGREKYIANGSLTSVGNAYNIVDAEIKIMTTDISGADIGNGFLFNNESELIGIVNDVVDNSGVGGNIVSIIPMDNVDIFLNKLMDKQQISYLGIYGKEVTDEVIENIDDEMPYGIYISNIQEQSPAYDSGIMSGDIITYIDNSEITDFVTFTDTLQNINVGTAVAIKVMRKGKDGYKEIDYSVEIGGR